MVGFDDISPCKYVEPPLTTVHVPLYELGVRGLRLALDLLAGHERPRPESLPLELTVRSSTRRRTVRCTGRDRRRFTPGRDAVYTRASACRRGRSRWQHDRCWSTATCRSSRRRERSSGSAGCSPTTARSLHPGRPPRRRRDPSSPASSPRTAIRNTGRMAAILGVVVAGQVLVMLVRCVDLSVAAVIGFTAVLVAEGGPGPRAGHRRRGRHRGRRRPRQRLARDVPCRCRRSSPRSGCSCCSSGARFAYTEGQHVGAGPRRARRLRPAPVRPGHGPGHRLDRRHDRRDPSSSPRR